MRSFFDHDRNFPPPEGGRCPSLMAWAEGVNAYLYSAARCFITPILALPPSGGGNNAALYPRGRP
jgi:hypothetical protein